MCFYHVPYGVQLCRFRCVQNDLKKGHRVNILMTNNSALSKDALGLSKCNLFNQIKYYHPISNMNVEFVVLQPCVCK